MTVACPLSEDSVDREAVVSKSRATDIHDRHSSTCAELESWFKFLLVWESLRKQSKLQLIVNEIASLPNGYALAKWKACNWTDYK